ncbi:AI-2E family transporter [Halomonas sp. McH1-25]|uniref:AI-2E family transporter n=1 Tax=unclassified Halomonas TaxID=2609666 RepID=UPI001EF70AC3|nr:MULTISPECIES: AI-2E family transporter [unclassified Halomonas]MCG7598750.1 AI-2E family transporter [Halomonas sp. McH1-25]MCP1340713.1 AI-2E family transporter [Halomonas sp. FL8]MCP1359484.1 AI-2E family transporter [Halomonas sp. BBD45]
MSRIQVWSLLGLAAIIWLLALLEPILMPFFISMILAYLGDPLTDALEARGLSRRLAVSVVFLVLSLAIGTACLIIIPLLGRQLAQLVEAIPIILAWVQSTVLPWVQSVSGMDFSTDFDQLREALMANWKETGTFAATLLAQVSRSGLAVIVWIANLALIPVVTFYLLLDWDRLKGRIQDLLPRRFEPTVTRLAKDCDEVLAAFLRGQLMVMLSLGIVYAIGLTLIGIQFGVLIGLVAGLASIVPYLGVIVGLAIAALVAFFQYGDLLHLAGVGVVFAVGQMLEGMVLQPMLLGDRIGLHPVAVIFAVLAGGQLFGFTGILLALPVAAVVMVLLRYLHERYKNSTLYDVAGQRGGDEDL